MLPTHAARASSPLAVLISQGIQRSAPGKQDWQLHTCAAWVLGFRVPGEKKSSGRTPACQSARPCRPEAAAWLAANVKSARFPAAARGFAAAPPPPHLASCRVSTLTGHLQGPGRSSERQQRSLRQHFRRVHAASRTTQGLPGSTFRPRKYIPCTPVSDLWRQQAIATGVPRAVHAAWLWLLLSFCRRGLSLRFRDARTCMKIGVDRNS